MSAATSDCPPVESMVCNAWSRVDADPHEVQAHHLLCAICVRGGCQSPPGGRATIDALLDVLWSYPHIPLKITADLDVTRAHYFRVYGERDEPALPTDAEERLAAYSERRKDLEVCRILGIFPNTVQPAFFAYSTLLARVKSLSGMCCDLTADTGVWPECPHARAGYFEQVADTPRRNLRDQTELGEDLAGHGIWAVLRPRTRADMKQAKEESARFIREHAKRLYIRPNHLLCVLCTRSKHEPLIEDNLVELRQRIEADPDIPIVLTEGCCMVCDPCNVYHPGEHLCYGTHPKNVLRDLRMLEMLGLAPGTEMSARHLFRRIYDRFDSFYDVCGWGDGEAYAPFWAPCGGHRGSALNDARSEDYIL